MQRPHLASQSMAVVVFTHSAEGHLGTKDPTTGNFFDGIHKHIGCIAVAERVAWMTGAPNPDGQTIDPSVRLRDGHGNHLPQIQFVEVTEPAPDSLLSLVHPPEFLRSLRDASEAVPPGMTADWGNEAQVSAGTYRAATLGAGAVSEATDFALQNRGQTGYAMRWPPSHHAEPTYSAGYSYINDVSAKARQLAADGYEVIMVDLDNHESNGDVASIAGVDGIFHIDMCQLSYFHRRSGTYRGTYIDPETGEPVRGTTEFPHRNSSSVDQTTAHVTPLPSNAVRIEVYEKDHKYGRQNYHDKGETPEALTIRFVNEAIAEIEKRPRREGSKGRVVFVQYGTDSLQGDPIGGMGHNSGSHFTIIRGLRLAMPDAAFVGVMQGGYHEEGWKRGIPAALLAFHVEIDDPGARSTLFKKYGGAFPNSPYRKVILEQDARGAIDLVLDGVTTDSAVVAQSVNVLIDKFFREQAAYDKLSYGQRAWRYLKSRVLKYGTAEVAGTVSSILGVLGAAAAGADPIVTGIVATWAENFGFYPTLVGIELRDSARELRARGKEPNWQTRKEVLAKIVAKCGIAEVVDTVLTRPAIMAGGAWAGKASAEFLSTSVETAVGVVGFFCKFAADVVFYSMMEITEVGIKAFLRRRLSKLKTIPRLTVTTTATDSEAAEGT